MIFSIATQKGGTGKTTTSISIAANLAHNGKRVLLVDIDSQANSSKVLLPHYPNIDKNETIYRTILHRDPLPVHKTSIPGLEIAPAHILLSNTDVELTTAKDHREARLKAQLDTISGDYDHVLIDCPPALSWLTVNAFTASEGVVVVVAPGYFELDSIVQIGKAIEEVRNLFNPGFSLLGYLFTMADTTINSRTSLKILRQTYTDEVYNTVIPRNTDIRDAHFNKQDIFTYKDSAPTAHAYRKLVREMKLV